MMQKRKAGNTSLFYEQYLFSTQSFYPQSIFLLEYIEANVSICSYIISAIPVREFWWNKIKKPEMQELYLCH